jgi:hypothetical protein
MDPQTKPPRKPNYRERMLAERKAGTATGKPRTRIQPVSAKRAKDGPQYSKLRAEFLKAHPICQRRGCFSSATEIHHKARRGKFLLRTDTWMSACRLCHDYIEAHPAWATDQGYILTHEQKRKLA